MAMQSNAPQPAAIEFRLPTTIVHGVGAAQQTGQRAQALGARRVLLVSDPGVAASGTLEAVEESLRVAEIPFERFTEVEAEPSAQFVEASLGTAARVEFDAIVAVGGGSALDVAKGFRLLRERGGVLRDYAGSGRVTEPLRLPLIALSTTAGTGSQVSFAAVFVDRNEGAKFAVVGPNIAATLAINDPLLTVTCPPKATAIAGMDALAHAVESCASLKANPFSRMFSVQAARDIILHLPTAYEQGNDVPARDAMLLASTIAIMPTSFVGVGLGHAAAAILCALYGLPHGLVTGMLVAPVIECNLAAGPEPYLDLARALGHSGSPREAVQALADQVRAVARRVGLPVQLREMGVRKDDLPRIVAGTLASYNLVTNPRPLAEGDLYTFYQQYL